MRPFLPLMMRTVEFGATADSAPVLKAMKTLAELLTTKSKRSATYLCHLSQYLAHVGLTTWRSLIELSGVVDRCLPVVAARAPARRPSAARTATDSPGRS